MTDTEWHFVAEGRATGPYAVEQMMRYIAQGRLQPQTLVWHDGLAQWEPAAAHFAGFGGAPEAALGPDGLYVGAPSRGFTEAAAVCLQKYFSIAGRASRSEYWFFVLFGMLISTLASAADMFVVGLANVIGVFSPLAWLMLVIPSITVSIRRLHDINKSGWWIGAPYMLVFGVVLFASLVMMVAGAMTTFASELMISIFGLAAIAFTSYTIVLFVFFCIRGTPGPNRFG